jgi:hypothetical protein
MTDMAQFANRTQLAKVWVWLTPGEVLKYIALRDHSANSVG